MKKDIENLTNSNEWLKSTLQSAQEQSEAMDLARKNVLKEIEEEKSRVEELESEINALKMEVEKLRREREELRSAVLVNQELVRSADQDRHLIQTGLEQQRLKLQEWRAARADCLSEKNKLVEGSVLLQTKWQSPHTLPVIYPGEVPPPGPPAQRRETVYRDRKGIPNSVSYQSPARVPLPATTRQQWETFEPSSRNILNPPSRVESKASPTKRFSIESDTRLKRLTKDTDHRVSRETESPTDTSTKHRKGSKRRSRSRSPRKETTVDVSSSVKGSLDEFAFD
eukprot:Blabericola_migrator_1__3902@NODE_217_length_11276_cov_60_022660_g184_i0_p5_GENE_NODE_217_length_11276_cov_60_022660_g184_i0NODE_217_length_11276_cov_60_022660_g184_i0_p5_ORF_typecomplete_len283_score64_30WEMBL/PF05701_11/7_2e06CENPF_leu_zip/PF10473_9/0_00023FlaC_arch/PF05377_11/7_1e02FlaC_arch/PF05377_11/0_0011SHE3/PF17078_5/0_0013DUF4618/PF15397_6/0_0032KASH_CCD/PF14662_6/0_0063DUF724/PF05266_14/0_018Spc7/PF08317_11/0_013HSBP1/PF06825_12/0_056FapA/PF03961_13/0_03PI3K_P85_iSH2/PF16454_5/0_053MC